MYDIQRVFFRGDRDIWALLAIILTTLMGRPVFAAGFFDVAGLVRSQQVSLQAEVLEDEERALSLLQAVNAAAWRPAERTSFNFGLSSSVWWLRLKLTNSGATAQDLVLDLGAAQQERVDWHVVTVGSSVVEASGSLGIDIPFSNRLLKASTLAVPVHLKGLQERVVYLRLQAQHAPYAIMPMTLYSRVFFDQEEQVRAMLLLGWHILLLLVVFLCAMLYAVHRVAALGHMTAYLLMLMVYSMTLTGVDQLYLNNINSYWHYVMHLLSGACAFVFGNWSGVAYWRSKIDLLTGGVRGIQWWTGAVLITVPFVLWGQFLPALIIGLVAGIALTLAVIQRMTVLMSARVKGATLTFLSNFIMLVIVLMYYGQLFGALPAYSSLPVGSLGGVAVSLLILMIIIGTHLKNEAVSIEREKVRQDMVRFVAHDIRAPQVAILAAMEHGGTLFEDKDVRHVVERQASRTLRLADDFLWLSRSESLDFQGNWIFLGDLVCETIDQAWAQSKAKQIKIHHLGLENELCEIWADWELLARAIFNLLDNAIKYSPPASEILVSMSLTNGEVLLSIKDQGIGMQGEDQSVVFEEFRRGMRDGFGHGIGLAFVANVMEKHQARIRCESSVGRGTTFFMHFRPRSGGGTIKSRTWLR